MKKKQFERLEKLLVDTVDAHVHSNTLLHSMMSDQRDIAEAHAEGGAAILEAMGDVEVRIGIATERASDHLDSIDAQMAASSTASSTTIRYSGDSKSEGAVSGGYQKIDVELKPTEDADAIQQEAVARMERKLKDCQDMHQATLEKLGEAQQYNGDLSVVIRRLQAQRDEQQRRADDLDKKLGAIAGWVREFTGKDQHDFQLLESIQLIMKGAKESYEDLAKANQHLERKLTETNAELVRATAKQGPLPDDASVGAFHQWIGIKGWAWVMDHTEQLSDAKDLKAREEAYNRRQENQAAKDAEMREFNERSKAVQERAGVAIVQDATTTEDRGVFTTTLGKPRPIRDNPQA